MSARKQELGSSRGDSQYMLVSKSPRDCQMSMPESSAPADPR